MITKDDIKCELFAEVELTKCGVDIFFKPYTDSCYLSNDGKVWIETVSETGCTISKEQFDEIIRVRKLLMEQS